MIIVAGHSTVAPRQRESYLAASVIIVERARQAVGCLDCAVSADLIDLGRVNIFERWESQAALDTFRRNGPKFEQEAAIRGVGGRVRHRQRAAPVWRRRRINRPRGPVRPNDDQWIRRESRP